MIVRTGWPSELWGCGAHAASPPIPCGVQPEYEAWWTAALEQHLQFIKQRFVRAMPLDPSVAADFSISSSVQLDLDTS